MNGRLRIFADFLSLPIRRVKWSIHYLRQLGQLGQLGKPVNCIPDVSDHGRVSPTTLPSFLEVFDYRERAWMRRSGLSSFAGRQRALLPAWGVKKAVAFRSGRGPREFPASAALFTLITCQFDRDNIPIRMPSSSRFFIDSDNIWPVTLGIRAQ